MIMEIEAMEPIKLPYTEHDDSKVIHKFPLRSNLLAKAGRAILQKVKYIRR
jgi:hypothetical protein